MNYAEIKMYQAVKIGKVMETFISSVLSSEDKFYRHKDVSLADWNNVGVLIKTSEAEVLIPYTNIAYALPAKKESKSKKA